VNEYPTEPRWAPATPGDDQLRIGRTSSAIVIEWRGIGRLSAPLAGGSPTFVPEEPVRPDLLKKFQATELLACRRYLAGRASLHGSAVALGGQALVLVGASGAGKSTTAMALVEHSGASFLADDIVPIDWVGTIAHAPPVDDALWLTSEAREHFRISDAAGAKRACPPRARGLGPAPVRAIVLLEFDDAASTPRLVAMTGHDTFVALSQAHVSFSLGDNEGVLRDFETRTRLAAALPLLRLVRRKAIGGINAAVNVLSRYMRADGSEDGRA